MMPRFRLPVSQEYAESCLAMAVAAEVESRGHSISPDGDFEQCVRQTAAWTVNASPRHSLLLAGRYGNGKTTFLRALQNLVNAFDLRDPMTGKRMRMPLYNAVALTEMHRTSVAEWHNVARAPLLAIDDLGTELTNTFTASQLFACINERILRRKATIISTNLALDDIKSIYSERIFSRLSSSYTMLRLTGDDIRIQKKLLNLGGTKDVTS